MVRKLHLKENAITDLRKWVNSIDLSTLDNQFSGKYDSRWSSYSRKPVRGDFKPSETTIKTNLLRWLEDTLKNKYRYDFNTEQLNLTPIQKPKGPVVAKKNPNLLIGIDSESGNAVVIGQGYFHQYFSGLMGTSYGRDTYRDNSVPEDPVPDYYDYHKHNRVSLRDLWDDLDLWLEIVPQENYQKRSEIQKDRGDIAKITSSDKKYIEKQIYDFELDLYEPKYARDNYARKLKVFKNRKKYNELLNNVETINDRIRSIDFGHPIFDADKLSSEDVKYLRRGYKDLISHIEDLNRAIEDDSEWRMTDYEDYTKRDLANLDDILSTRFGV